jgi:hypothetical protein
MITPSFQMLCVAGRHLRDESLRSTIGIAADQTAIEYEYRFTEYRFAEYEYDENNRLTRSQRRGCRYSALISCSATQLSAPAWI